MGHDPFGVIGRLHFVVSQDFTMSDLIWLQHEIGKTIEPVQSVVYNNAQLFHTKNALTESEAMEFTKVLTECELKYRWFSWRILP